MDINMKYKIYHMNRSHFRSCDCPVCQEEYEYFTNLETKIKQLEEVIWAKNQLLVCYRLGGRRPTEKVMKILDKWDDQKALEK